MPKTNSSRLHVQNRQTIEDLSIAHGAFDDRLEAQLLHWFTAQPKAIQGAILGHYPAGIQADVATIILKQMAKQKAA